MDCDIVIYDYANHSISNLVVSNLNISNLGIIFVLLHLMHHVPRLLIFTQQSVLEMRLAFIL